MTSDLIDFFNKEPEQIIKWDDEYSDAQGWLVINSLYNGAAGGGTRMGADCEENEIKQLAKTMEIKFTVSGPDIGGAKSGIKYDFKNDQDKIDVLGRWFEFVSKQLKSCYGTGGDRNIDISQHAIPSLKRIGIRHPQEGIVNGLYPGLSKTERIKILDNLNKGVSLKLQKDKFLSSIDFKISDIATGFGVVASIQRFYDLANDSFLNKKVIIEGFGNVGAGVAYYAVKGGARVVGIIDKDWYLFNDHGININEMLDLRHKGLLNCKHPGVTKDNDQIGSYPDADIFIPAATSHTIDKQKLEILRNGGIKVIALGANNAFIDYDIEDEADKEFYVIADFIANSGMARCFSYLMKRESVINEESIMKDIKLCMNTAMDKIMKKNNPRYNLNSTAYNIALEDIKNRQHKRL